MDDHPDSPAEAWAAVIEELGLRAARPRRARLAALLGAASSLSVAGRWAAMYPALLDAELWIAPRPRGSWARGMPKLSVRYVASARRFRGCFARHRESVEGVYACPPEGLAASLEGGWRRLCGQS